MPSNLENTSIVNEQYTAVGVIYMLSQRYIFCAGLAEWKGRRRSGNYKKQSKAWYSPISCDRGIAVLVPYNLYLTIYVSSVTA